MTNYPPYLEGKISSQYGNILKIPFQINRAHNVEGAKMALIIKTVSTNVTVIGVQDLSSYTIDLNGRQGILTYQLDEDNPLAPGLFYKVQLAFMEGNVVSYFSNTAVFKYTNEPQLTIEADSQLLTGHYENTDITEKVEYYKFDIYRDDKLIESTDWKVHDSSRDGETTKSYDTYEIKDDMASGSVYVAYYYIKTNNGLELGPVISNRIQQGQVPFDSAGFVFKVEQDCDNGRVTLDITIGHSGKYKIYRDNLLLRNVLAVQGQLITIYDNAVEHGAYHSYYIQQYDDKIYTTKYLIDEPELIEFDDMFLSDNERQLCIRFNPKVTSFKTTLAENKIDTIGSKYPSFFRNGIIGYKEFPISGLISHLIDPNGAFMALEPVGKYEQPHNLTHANFKRERDFKIAVLDWLNNGKPKLFRSPAEGNYLVRLMNVSLSPDDKLGRMLHTFSSTAYEIDECSHESLVKLGFIDSEYNATKYGLVAGKTEKEPIKGTKEFTEADRVLNITIEGPGGSRIKIDNNTIILNNTGTFVIDKYMAAQIRKIETEDEGVTVTYEYYKNPEDLTIKYQDKIVIGVNYPMITINEGQRLAQESNFINILSLQIWGSGEYKLTYNDGTTAVFISPGFIEYLDTDLINVIDVEVLDNSNLTVNALVKQIQLEEDNV